MREKPLIWCADCHEYYEVSPGTLTAKCPTGRHDGDKVPRSPALVAVRMLKAISDQIESLAASIHRDRS